MPRWQHYPFKCDWITVSCKSIWTQFTGEKWNFRKFRQIWRNVEKFLAILALKAPISDAFHWNTPIFVRFVTERPPFDAICHRKTPTSEVLGGTRTSPSYVSALRESHDPWSVLDLFSAVTPLAPLGMEDGSITDDQITASSYDGDYEPRLNNPNGQWSPEFKDLTPWIQVKFSSAVYITAIQTQGSPIVNRWVTELQIQTGDSEDSLSYIMDEEKETVSIWY